MEETFTQMLLRFMAERKITRAGLYKDADIDRKLIYKILKQKDYQPKKGTAVRLALGLRLSPEETKALLEAEGFSDIVVRKDAFGNDRMVKGSPLQTSPRGGFL